ncbi:hypothetical protein HZB03_02695 [Candidatus Woesearchaeota archaeon]|nr:hypothetical protein [Candidatus Woesearchaeota archaeon]
MKYPKLSLLLLTFFVAYLLFAGEDFGSLHPYILSLGYAGAFIAGIFYVYSFSAAFATAVFLIIAKQHNIILAGLVGGPGSLLGDLIIFRFIRHSFADEIEKLSQERFVIHIHHRTPNILRKLLYSGIAAFFIASPLPDEIGVMLLAASRDISTRTFSILSYTLNTAGIFVILGVGAGL